MLLSNNKYMKTGNIRSHCRSNYWFQKLKGFSWKCQNVDYLIMKCL